MISLCILALSCNGDAPSENATPSATTTHNTVAMPPTPLPETAPETEPEVQIMPDPVCPPDMVKVTPREPPTEATDPVTSYCVDRYEAMLVGHASGQRIPPYYAPSRKAAAYQASHWDKERFEMGAPKYQQIGLPQLPPWMLQGDFQPRAVVRKNVLPNGHVSGEQAQRACANAQKRLCSQGEWQTACRGKSGEQFPYGSEFVHRKCNVFREGHPAQILHDKASIGHTDPRLNKVRVNGKPLLRKTGETASCASVWDDGDAVYDMVGNVDEWLADSEGVFAGGFYARATKKGCDQIISGHTFNYGDYSTGVRCCADLPKPSR